MKVLVLMVWCLFINVAFADPGEHLAQLIESKSITIKSPRDTFQYKNKNFQVSDFDEVINAKLPKIIRNLESVAETKQFIQDYLKEKKYVVRSKTKSRQKEYVFDTTERLLSLIHSDDVEKHLEKAILECQEPVQDLKDIKSIISQVQSDECKPPSPGEHKVFVKKENYISGNYLLKHTSKGNFEALLNVNFQSGDGSVSPKDMLKRAQECLAKASLAMKGPDGKTLKLKILSPEEILTLPENQRPGPNTVTIKGPDYSTDAANYNENVKCATITHEALHLLGLCDEYEENREQFAKYKWNCRVITKTPSIMNSLSFYDSVLPESIRCECKSDICRSALNSNNEGVISFFSSQSFNDMTPVQNRIKYCIWVPKGFSNYRVIPSPEKRTIFVGSKNGKYTFLDRTLAGGKSNSDFSVNTMEITCTCPPGDTACTSMIEDFQKQNENVQVRTNCPAFTEEVKDKNTVLASKSVNLMEVNKEKGELILHPPISDKSLLQPGHFNKILTGNCRPSISNNYIECASQAYESPPCRVPPKCLDDKYYLGTQQ